MKCTHFNDNDGNKCSAGVGCRFEHSCSDCGHHAHGVSVWQMKNEWFGVGVEEINTFASSSCGHIITLYFPGLQLPGGNHQIFVVEWVYKYISFKCGFIVVSVKGLCNYYVTVTKGYLAPLRQVLKSFFRFFVPPFVRFFYRPKTWRRNWVKKLLIYTLGARTFIYIWYKMYI